MLRASSFYTALKSSLTLFIVYSVNLFAISHFHLKRPRLIPSIHRLPLTATFSSHSVSASINFADAQSFVSFSQIRQSLTYLGVSLAVSLISHMHALLSKAFLSLNILYVCERVSIQRCPFRLCIFYKNTHLRWRAKRNSTKKACRKSLDVLLSPSLYLSST